jgi:hypothetical protein
MQLIQWQLSTRSKTETRTSWKKRYLAARRINYCVTPKLQDTLIGGSLESLSSASGTVLSAAPYSKTLTVNNNSKTKP